MHKSRPDYQRRAQLKRRNKCFGHGYACPCERETKARIEAFARSQRQRTLKGKAYGNVTAKGFDVLNALLWRCHNAKDGLCFSSYNKIAELAACACSTVAKAIQVLEAIGILSWVHRLKRIVKNGVRKVVRTSNGYIFNDPLGMKIPAFLRISRSKSEKRLETNIQSIFSLSIAGKLTGIVPVLPVEEFDECLKLVGHAPMAPLGAFKQ